ncbi:hypothetical protein GALL_458880 [mine drainage metagenome]|uniref:Uncharacterized protein n=1 Tax=mine drainage metagenome TaxID=410659 RepID=A0A1J5PY27_9ZZZZ
MPSDGFGRIKGSAGFGVALARVIVVSFTFVTVTPSSRKEGLPFRPCTRFKENTMSSAVTGVPSEKVCLPVRVSVSSLLSADSV